jgi:hypothetical protein
MYSTPMPTVQPSWVTVVLALSVLQPVTAMLGQPGGGWGRRCKVGNVLVMVADPGGAAFCINECLRRHCVADATGRGSEPASLSGLFADLIVATNLTACNDIVH